MSVDATRWAWEQKVRGTDKLVLLSLADRADENFLAFPSAMRLTKDTGLNGKTVFAALQRLLESGLIEDTGEKVGDTGRVKIYRLMGCNARENAPKNGGIRNAKKVAAIAKKAAETECTQKRNDTENGIIPNLDSNTPKNGSRNTPKNGCQNLKDLTNKNLGDINPESLVIPPEAPRNESATETPPGFDEFKIPDWLDPDLWKAWVKFRRERYEAAYDELDQVQSVGELLKAHQRGQDLRQVIRHAMVRHFKHPYPLKTTVGADIPLQEIVNAYRRICVPAGMLVCENMPPELEVLIAKRVRDGGMTLGDWECFFEHAAKKPELTGKVPPGNGFTKPYRASLFNLLENKRFARIDEEIRTELLA